MVICSILWIGYLKFAEKQVPARVVPGLGNEQIVCRKKGVVYPEKSIKFVEDKKAV